LPAPDLILLLTDNRSSIESFASYAERFIKKPVPSFILDGITKAMDNMVIHS
jgi:hypothetical protein